MKKLRFTYLSMESDTCGVSYNNTSLGLIKRVGKRKWSPYMLFGKTYTIIYTDKPPQFLVKNKAAEELLKERFTREL